MPNNKRITTHGPEKDQTPMGILISLILANLYLETHLYTKVKRSYLRIPTLTAQYTIHKQIETFYDGLTKGFIGTVQCKGGRYILPTLKWCNNGCVQPQVEKLKPVISPIHHHRAPKSTLDELVITVISRKIYE